MVNHRHTKPSSLSGTGRMVSALLALVLACSVVTAREAQQPRTIFGEVVNESGSPVPHLEVRLEGFGLSRRSETDLFGQFRFFNVGQDASRLVVEGVGFRTFRQHLSAVRFSGRTRIVISRYRRVSIIKPSSQVIDVHQLAENFPREAVKECEKGLRAREKGQTGRAIAHLEKAVHLAPDYCRARINLGALYHSLGRLDEAEEEYLHARRLSRNNPLPLINLGEIYLNKGQAELAIEVLREATSITPTPALAFYNLGIALFRADQLAEAEKSLLRANSLDPKLESVRLMLANIYLRTQDPARLLEQLEAYLDEYPDGKNHEKVEKMRSAILRVNGLQHRP